MKRGFYLLFLMCFLFSGCDMMQSRPTASFPLKIGLLSDSQITSQNGFSDFHYRSKMADALVDVSIRPPALECILAKEMLQTALNKLTQDTHGSKQGLDVILYLGDAANSGGADEIDTVLAILTEHRQKTAVPIFILIGNHDYLGAGNIVSPGIRFAMLNQLGRPDNPALTKYEVLKRFSDFNHANNQLPAATRFRYTDNIEAVERNKDRDHRTGLYLCGCIAFTETGTPPVQILMLDTSDYKDAPDWSQVMSLGFYGAIGSVSFKDEPGFVSQTTCLSHFAGTSSTAFRFLISHYPKDHLDRITFAKPREVPLNITNLAWEVTENAFSLPTFSETLNQKLLTLLTSGKCNYWLSGHTHVHGIPAPERFILGGLAGEKFVTALNVGSTTDYRAHIAIVEAYDARHNNKLDNSVGYRQIPLFDCDDTVMVAVTAAMEEYARQNVNDTLFKPLIPTLNQWLDKPKQNDSLLGLPASLLSGLQKKPSAADRIRHYWIDVGAMILGLNKTYRLEAWTDEHTLASALHLQDFITRCISRTGRDRSDIVTCLGLLAGAYENDLLPETFSVDMPDLKKLCTTPM
jgi:hypothetical protein